eukprot:CAMPEP_0170582770 /NCGR_PEP_ID=MMETSP0224-20130122/7764_1 /TAXON_ID=285029 /ORGANISM="Togula jolla, Strain CCCM 725" /LENGTH=629 /DNA_ID=CAMNT_0010906023 /DNA_START=12 /DNA_END=1901 /DNA_ORIENTATION=+
MTGNGPRYTPLTEGTDPEGASVCEYHDRGIQEIERLEKQMLDSREREMERRQRLTEVNDFWGKKVYNIEAEIQRLRQEAEDAELALRALTNNQLEDNEDYPPGPASLRWVQGTAFMCVANVVIIANITSMVMESVNHDYMEDFFLLDQFYMIFYNMELCLKWLLLRRGLLIGNPRVVWWNWLDLIIVIAGDLDMYLTPLLSLLGVISHSSGSGSGPSLIGMLRLARLARLARILKVLNIFLRSDLSWAEGDRFNMFIMGVIAFNSVVMGFETDYPDFPAWFYVEQVLLCIFCFELSVRVKFLGFADFFFGDSVAWNWLDFTIVAGGVIDQWMMPGIDLVRALNDQQPLDLSSMGQTVVLLRMARLLRVLRLVKLIKGIPPLYTLVRGIVEALQGMAWVLVLTVVVLYIFSLLAVRLIGRGLAFDGNPPDEAVKIFPNVPQAMFVLFKVMNSDLDPLEPLFPVMPIAKLFATIFMVLSSWAILSILTAVISENMIKACESAREQEASDSAGERAQRSRVKLKEIFQAADTSGNSVLSLSECEKMLADPNVVEELSEASGMSKRGIEDLFTYLSRVPKGSKDPIITHEDFIDGLVDEQRPVTERSVLRLEKRLAALEAMVRDVAESVNHKH